MPEFLLYHEIFCATEGLSLESLPRLQPPDSVSHADLSEASRAKEIEITLR